MALLYTTTRCSICKGSGLVKKEPFKCKICTENSFNTCSMCEFRQFKGSYSECETCFGNGEIFKDRQTKKRIFPSLINQYSSNKNQ